MLQGECRTSSSLIRRRPPSPHSSPIGHPVDRRSDRIYMGHYNMCVLYTCVVIYTCVMFMYVRTKKQLITTRSVHRLACVRAPVHRVMLFGNITVLLSSPEKTCIIIWRKTTRGARILYYTNINIIPIRYYYGRWNESAKETRKTYCAVPPDRCELQRCAAADEMGEPR